MHIPEIELAFSNACTANCYICSPVHGGHNEPFMSQIVFDKAVERMQDITFDILQTGGDGDSFLNPIYLNSLRTLRQKFPNVKIVLYSNFALLEPNVADILIYEGLINELYTRIDTLLPGIFRACTGLDQDNVFNNIDHFLSRNKSKGIKFQINYSNIQDYYNKCKRVLDLTPVNWTSIMYDAPRNEFENIKQRFSGAHKYSEITQSLWAERHNPALVPEPETKCERGYCFNTTLYIWTEGNVGICGYDDGQNALIYGNIMKETIPELWNGEDKQKVINRVLNREIKGYPCINPKCCLFY